jgi:hypothetical protein
MNKSSNRDEIASLKTKQVCDKSDAVVEVFLKETGQEEKFRFLDHIFSCPVCLSEFKVLKEIWSKEKPLWNEELAQKLKQTQREQVKSISNEAIKVLKQEKKSRKNLPLSPKNIAAVTVVFMAAVLIVYVATQRLPEQIPIEREVGSEIFKTIEPEGAVSKLPILFRWHPVQGAREYAIEVLDKGLEVIYRKEGIQVASFALPDRIYAQLQLSQTYFWKVIASMDDGKNIESEFGKFHLAAR